MADTRPHAFGATTTERPLPARSATMGGPTSSRGPGRVQLASSGPQSPLRTTGTVKVRLVFEETGVAVAHHLDWQPAETRPDSTWSATLERIPAGGLYRLETHFNPTDNLAGEWSARGDNTVLLGLDWAPVGDTVVHGAWGMDPALAPMDVERVMPMLGFYAVRVE